MSKFVIKNKVTGLYVPPAPALDADLIMQFIRHGKVAMPSEVEVGSAKVYTERDNAATDIAPYCTLGNYNVDDYTVEEIEA